MFLSMLLAGAFAPAIALGDPPDRIIAAGRGIGAARLGMPVAGALAALGKPDAKYHVSDGYLYVFGALRLLAADDGRIARVETDSADYRTPDGLGIGSAETEIAARLGAPARAEDIKTRNDNLLMTIGRRICYEPGLTFVADYTPGQPRVTTRIVVRGDGCAHAFGD
ncbi:MAG TPA: hypothetical protein VIJ42_06745 [Stellaceae bacterium]